MVRQRDREGIPLKRHLSPTIEDQRCRPEDRPRERDPGQQHARINGAGGEQARHDHESQTHYRNDDVGSLNRDFHGGSQKFCTRPEVREFDPPQTSRAL